MKHLLTILCLMLLAGPVFGQPIIKNKNFSHDGLTTPITQLPSGKIYHQCNMSVGQPYEYEPGQYKGWPLNANAPTTVSKCNLVNRQTNANIVVLSGNTSIIRRQQPSGTVQRTFFDMDQQTTHTIQRAKYWTQILGKWKPHNYPTGPGYYTTGFPKQQVVGCPDSDTTGTLKQELYEDLKDKERAYLDALEAIRPYVEP